MIGPAQYGNGNPVQAEADMFHAVFIDDEVQEIIADGGAKRIEGILADIRQELCPNLGPMQNKLLDMIEPMKREHHKDDGQIEYYQQLDRPEVHGAWDVD